MKNTLKSFLITLCLFSFPAIGGDYATLLKISPSQSPSDMLDEKSMTILIRNLVSEKFLFEDVSAIFGSAVCTPNCGGTLAYSTIDSVKVISSPKLKATSILSDISIKFTLSNILSIRKVVSIETDLPIDIYDPTKNELTIPFVKVGDTTYKDVVVKVGKILTLGSSPANDTQDSYNFSTGILNIPTVALGLSIYYNVSITIGDIVSVGGVL